MPSRIPYLLIQEDPLELVLEDGHIGPNPDRRESARVTAPSAKQHAATIVIEDANLGSWASKLPRPCAGMIQSVPELGTSLGTNSIEGGFRSGQLPENSGGQGRD